MDPKHPRAAAAVALPAAAQPPREILLLPAGEIPTRPHDGRPPWHNPDAGAVVAATRELTLDLAIDYDHQSDRSAANGQPAPAAGWIRRVFERDGAVWGEVEWTERAAAMIRAREYRFVSPVFRYETATRVVRRITGAALTNDPAMFMRAIASTQPRTETDMDLDKLRTALGLADEAGEAEILEAAAAAGGGPDPDDFVPRAEFDRLRETLARLETEGAEARATAAVDAAVKAGKVTPASRDWALGYARKDAAGFAEFVEGAPAILDGGRAVPAAAPGEGGDALTAEERAVCRATGVSEEDFRASRKALAAQTEEA